MGKFLLVLVIAVVVWWMWRKLQQPDRGAVTPPPVARPAELMVSCAHCGVNQPRSECVEHAGRYYCCAAHVQAAAHTEGRRG